MSTRKIMSRRKIWWTDLAAPEHAAVDPARTIAVLPLAAIEQHGPHLPVGTDTILNEGCLDMLAARVPDELDLRILPVQTAGKSNEHIWQKGTVSHAAHTLIDAWTEIGASVARAGIRKLVLINSHGGNEEIMGIVARELRVGYGMLVVKTSWSRFGTPGGMLSDLEKRHGIHGGDMETSLVMFFRPELVVHNAVQDFPSLTARDEAMFTHIRPTGTHAYAWIASDLNPHGVVGNAANASPERGRLIAEHQVAGMLELLADVARHPGLP